MSERQLSELTGENFQKPSLSSRSREYRFRLLNKIDKHFNLEELRTLCFAVGVDYDNLRGEGKVSKARELILTFQRQNQLSTLIEHCRKVRPEQEWPSPPKLPIPFPENLFDTSNIPISQIETSVRKWLRKNLFFGLAKHVKLHPSSITTSTNLVFIFRAENYVKYKARHLKFSGKGLPNTLDRDNWTYSTGLAKQKIALAVLTDAGNGTSPYLILMNKVINACNGFNPSFDSNKNTFYLGYVLNSIPRKLLFGIKTLGSRVLRELARSMYEPPKPYFVNLELAPKRLGPSREITETDKDALLNFVSDSTLRECYLRAKEIVHGKTFETIRKMSPHAELIEQNCSGSLTPYLYQFFIVTVNVNNKVINVVLNAKNIRILYFGIRVLNSK